jgi:hypothetical protein
VLGPQRVVWLAPERVLPWGSRWELDWVQLTASLWVQRSERSLEPHLEQR